MDNQTPARIVIDARYLAATFSGIGAYSQNLLEHMARLDTVSEYHVLVQTGYRRPLAVGSNFRLHRIDAAPLSWTTLTGLHGRIRALRPDLLHVHCPVIPPRYRGPMVVTVHDLQPLLMTEWSGGRPWPLPWFYRRFYGWMYPLAFARATRLLAVSESTRRALIERHPQYAGKTITAPNGFTPPPPGAVDPNAWERLRKRHALPERYALYVGSTRPNKNLPVMLAAFARFGRQMPDLADVGFVLVLSPDRFLREVTRIVAAEGLSDRVRILPQVDEASRDLLLRRAALLFFATRREGFGFPILEAQAAGVPVLTSTTDAAPEVAGEGALLVDWADIAGQADGLARLLSDDELRRRLIEVGRCNLMRFNWEAAALRTLETYRACLAERG